MTIYKLSYQDATDDAMKVEFALGENMADVASQFLKFHPDERTRLFKIEYVGMTRK